MRLHDGACEEALAIARGDLRDAPHLRAHLEACAPCARQTTALRVLVEMTRKSLEADASSTLERRPLLPIEAMLRGSSTSDPLQGLALAAAAAFVMVGLTALLAAHEAPAGRASSSLADASRSLPFDGGRSVLEVGSPEHERLPFVLRTAAGVREGELDLAPQDYLETIPANVVVVDTF